MTETNSAKNVSASLTGAVTGFVTAGVLVATRGYASSGDANFLGAFISMIVLMFAGLPLYMATMAQGSVAGLVGLVAGTAGLMTLGQGGVIPFFLMFHALPLVALGSMAVMVRDDSEGRQHWFPEGYLVTALVLYPAIIFLGVFLYMAKEDGGLLGLMTSTFLDAWKAHTAQMSEETKEILSLTQIPDIESYVRTGVRYLPMTLSYFWMTIVFMIGLTGQSILKKQRWTPRPSFTLNDFILPQWLLVVVAGTGVMGYLLNDPYAFLGFNLCAMLCVPFFFLGLAVVHHFANSRQSGSKMILWIFYLLLSIIPHLAILVALLGTLDIGLGLRQRMAKPIKPN